MAEAKGATGKILVTGSGGMLGIDLCNELSRDYDVIGLDVSQSAHIKCDITDRDGINKSVTSARPDIIIHLAAWTDVDGCELDPGKTRKINVAGAENIAQAARNIDALLIYISTDFVFDGKKTKPYNEEDLPDPLSVYGKSKFEAEKKIAKLKDYVIIRTSWLFGKNGKNFVESILDIAKKKKPLEVVDDQKGCPTYTKDLAKAIGKLLYAIRNTQYLPAGRQGAIRDIYHISNKGAVSWFEYAKEVLRLADLDMEIKPIKSSELKRPAPRPDNSALDISKFENFTGYHMRGWREALKDYLSEFFRGRFT